MKTSLLLMVCAVLLNAAPGIGQIIAPDAKVEKLAGDFQFTEGATSDKDGNVFFVDQPSNRILKYDTDGKLTTFMEPSNYSNGMCFDNQGNLIACADEKNEMWLIELATKKVTVILHNQFEGKLFNAPNDVWVSPAGRLYFTDPFYKRTWWTRGPKEMPENVYVISPDYKTVTRVIDDLVQPNGIIGTPDGKTLYVADIRANKTYSYDIQEDGTLANKKLFCEVGSDGMTIDSQGNVYCTHGTVQVFDKTGKKIEQITVPESPANVCFGGKDKQTLFITARKGLYALKMSVKGVGPQ